MANTSLSERYVDLGVKAIDNNIKTGPGIGKSEVLRAYFPGLEELYFEVEQEQEVIEETFEDSNRNGIYDPPEPFKDNNRNNKFDETAEEYTDTNGNGKWDKEEPFVDRITVQIDYPKTGPKKECLSCKNNKK